RNEQRRADGQPLPLGLEPVPHLVDEDQADQPDREPDPAEPKVRAERDEQPEQELVLEDPDAELRDERADRSERGPDLPAQLAPGFLPGVAWEWQWDAARMGAGPDDVLRSARRIKSAVIDSGADLRAPDVADKRPATWSVLSHTRRVRDVLGHGTFVSSLAAGSVENGVGISGFGGDARLLVAQAIDPDGYLTDVVAACAIAYAVKH